MRILGIETSCDETAAAIVSDGTIVEVNVIASSLLLHQKTGGIVPEIAARDSAEKIVLVIEEALEKANCDWKDLDAIAVTNGPGLLGSLMVGIEAAKTLALLYEKPLIPVFHIAGHIFSNVLERAELPTFPVVSLTVAGGHNDLYLWKEGHEIQRLGSTIDDAAGEAFDKGARLLGLSYPGGPALAKLAASGDPKSYDFPRPMRSSDDYNFSFSGLKTALFYAIEKAGGREKLSEKALADLAAAYQEAIADTLVTKLFLAAEEFEAREVHLAGGVSANLCLREKFLRKAEKLGLKTRIPAKIEYCTDNAAMIAAAGFAMWQKASVEQREKFSFKNIVVNLSHEFRFNS